MSGEETEKSDLEKLRSLASSLADSGQVEPLRTVMGLCGYSQLEQASLMLTAHTSAASRYETLTKRYDTAPGFQSWLNTDRPEALRPFEDGLIKAGVDDRAARDITTGLNTARDFLRQTSFQLKEQADAHLAAAQALRGTYPHLRNK